MIKKLIQAIKAKRKKYLYRKFKNITPSSVLSRDCEVYNCDNLIMEEHTNIYGDSVIMNTRAKFIMKKHSGAAIGLLVITGNHMSIKNRRGVTDKDKDNAINPKQYDKDIIVEDSVWIGARVTLLAGSHIGRGAFIGAGSVVRSSVPPYSIVVGNPAKVVGFRFTPEEIIEHEQHLYPENERLSNNILIKNYNKYYLKRVKELSHYLKI